MSGITPINSAVTTAFEKSTAVSQVSGQQPASVQEAIQARAAETDKPELTVEETQEVVDSLNSVMSLLQRGVAFQVDDATDRTIVRIVDRETDETIKQFPSEDLVRLIERMQEMQSLLFDNDSAV